MNITTSPKIWAHRKFLTVVHQANEIIEPEAGPKAAQPDVGKVYSSEDACCWRSRTGTTVLGTSGSN